MVTGYQCAIHGTYPARFVGQSCPKCLRPAYLPGIYRCGQHGSYRIRNALENCPRCENDKTRKMLPKTSEEKRAGPTGMSRQEAAAQNWYIRALRGIASIAKQQVGTLEFINAVDRELKRLGAKSLQEHIDREMEK